MHGWACPVWLREIPPRTLPDFIPSDHVHPLFISLTHSPRCRNMIPMSPPPILSPDNPHLFFSLASCDISLLLWIMKGGGGCPEEVCMHGCVHVLSINTFGATKITWYCTILSVGLKVQCLSQTYCIVANISHYFFFNFVWDHKLPAIGNMIYKILNMVFIP